MATDPICGMFVDERAATLTLVRDNRTYFFCSPLCREQFAAPEVARRRLWVRLWVAWPLAIAVVGLTYVAPSAQGWYVAAALAGTVQAYSAAPFYRGAWDAIRSRMGNMDLLIAVGTTTAFGYSLAALLLPARLPAEYYFDASSLIVALILTGNYLEILVRGRAGAALERLRDLVPRVAVRIEGDPLGEVSLDQLRSGDVVRVLPGGRFPVDGRVRAGHTTADESLLTGEARPVPKAPGSGVLAGSMNGEGAVEVAVERVEGDTFVAEVGRLLTDAEDARVPLRQTADRIASIFVPVVVALAVGAAIAWVALGGADVTVGVLVFVSVVITACPCAFGIATPAAIMVGVGQAARDGILFRGGDALERTASIDLLLTDKTGTLTTSHPVLAEVVPTTPGAERQVLGLAAGLARGSEHALGRAILDRANSDGVSPAPVLEVRVAPGEGIRGQVGGVDVAVLSGPAAGSAGVGLGSLTAAIALAEAGGEPWSVVVLGRSATGLLKFRAPLVPGASEAVARLSRLGVQVVMVTGDSGAVASRVAQEIGIGAVESGVRPEGKVALVRRYQRQGRHVGFVGDGINDAAALAAADAGLAIGSGTDVAREAGQVLLLRNDFPAVPRAIEVARRTVGRVRWNLTWALGYNLVLLPIAAGALVPLWGFGVYRVLPVAGAVAMALSSTTVVIVSLSLRWSLGRSPPVGGSAEARRPADRLPSEGVRA